MEEAMIDDSSTDLQTVVLPDNLDLTAALPLMEQLRFLHGKDVCLDASDVSRIGGQCLQILLAGAQTWANEENSFFIVNPSTAFSDGLETMGVPATTFANTEMN